LQVVKVQKQSAKVTELAVKRFEAQLAGTRSLQFDISQKIVEVENEINFLVGRFPQPIQRALDSFEKAIPDSIQAGLPSQLLENRPDIRQAELQLAASKLDVQVAKANFYPRLEINAGLGYQAFNPKYLLETPESLMYGVAGDIVSPLVNRNAIKAFYKNANERQKQAAIEYEQTILNAYVEVANQIANIQNLRQSYRFKFEQVQRLNESIDISNNLFRSARADYMEVLLTQEDALETEFELVETKVAQLQAWVSIYRALGGGWK
ncbi:MAG: TolC family protein, partial [Ekhidna sp.]